MTTSIEKVLDELITDPCDSNYKSTDEHPANWFVFIVSTSRNKRYFVRTHPNYIKDNRNSNFDEKDIDYFLDAWKLIETGELNEFVNCTDDVREWRQEKIRLFATFIVNKLSHLFLDTREDVIEMIQDERVKLLDFYISN